MNARRRTKTWRYLTRDRYSAYRQLFVKGRRIRATSLYDLTTDPDEPLTPAQAAKQYDLPVAAVREAIAYCRSNPPELEEDARMEEEAHKTAERMLAQIPKTRRSRTP